MATKKRSIIQLNKQERKRIDYHLIEALNRAIHNQVLDDPGLSKSEWKQFLILADCHRIANIIFPAVEGLLKSQAALLSFYEYWKKRCLIEMHQYNGQLKHTGHLFDTMEAAGIESILLKGYSCATNYPGMQRRSMADIDLLIHEGDLDETVQVLKDLGYSPKRVSDCEYEMSFEHPDRLKVEVHHHLTFFKHLHNDSAFAHSVWLEKTRIEVGNDSYPVLSSDMLVVYLIMHMVKHFSWDGLDMRMLSDLTLLLERQRDTLDWMKIATHMEDLKMKEFAGYIFRLCGELMGLAENPMVIELQADIYSDIRASVFIREENGFYENVFSRYMKEQDVQKKSLWDMRYILFPKAELMPARYTYLQKFPILLPLAWLHRFGVEVVEHPERAFGIWRSKTDVHKINKRRYLLAYFQISK